MEIVVNDDEETSDKKREATSDLSSNTRKSKRLRHENPDFDAQENLTKSNLKETMKMAQKELMAKFAKKRKEKEQDDPKIVKHVTSGNIDKLKKVMASGKLLGDDLSKLTSFNLPFLSI